jgi:hypothetical protein
VAQLFSLGGLHVYAKLGAPKIMTPQIAIMLTVIPFAIVGAAFFIFRFWLAKQPDRLVARHRALGLLILVFTALMVAAFALHFISPSLAPSGRLGALFALMLVFAIWQHRRLSRQL